MATNITGLAADRPLVDPDIAVNEDFLLGGHLTTSGSGGWNESAEIYFEWDQGTATWVSLASTGALNIAAQGNPTAVLQDTNEHQVTVYSDGTAGSFQVRLKAIEDDATEYTTTPVDVTVTGIEDIDIGTGGILYDSVGVDAELGVTVSLPDPLIISVYDEVTVEEDVTGDVVIPSTAFEIDVSETILVIESYMYVAINTVFSTEVSVGNTCITHQSSRIVIPSALLNAASGNRIRLQIQATASIPCWFDSVTVGQSDVSAFDMEAGTLTRIKWDGAYNVACPANETLWSDWTKYKHFDGGDLVISTFMDYHVPPQPCHFYWPLATVDSYWHGSYDPDSLGGSPIVVIDQTLDESYDNSDATLYEGRMWDFIGIEIGNSTHLITFHPDFVFIDEQQAVEEIFLYENVSLLVYQLNLEVDIYDEVSIEEFVDLALELTVNIYDEVTVEENVTVLPHQELLETSVYDEVAIDDVNTELVYQLDLSASVYEEVGIDEDINFAFVCMVNVYDEVGVDEYWLEDITLFVSVYDEVSIEEDVLVSLPDALVVDLNDEVTVTEADYVPQLGAAGDCDVNLYDEVGIDELVVSSLPDDLIVSVDDSVTVVDKTPVYQLLYDTKVAVGIVTGISVYDEITLTENIVIEHDLEIVIYDEVTVSEDVDELVYTVGGDTREIDVYSEVTIAEYTSFEFVSFILMYDEVSINEDTSIVFTELYLSVYDEITTSENTDQVFEFIQINLYEEITVVDASTVVVGIVGEYHVSVVDTISLVDVITIQNVSLYATVDDEVSITESVILTMPDLVINLYDSIIVVEDADLINSLAGVSIEDSITVTDVPTVNVNTATCTISVYDNISLGENTQVEVSDLEIVISDGISVTEYTNIPQFYNLIDGSILFIEDIVLILPEFDIYTKLSKTSVSMEDTESIVGLILPNVTTVITLPTIEMELL